MKPFYISVPDFCSRESMKEKLITIGRADLAGNDILLDKMLFTIHLIIRRMVTSTIKEEFDVDKTRLKSSYLHKQIGRAGNAQYTTVIDSLILIDMISQNPSYLAGSYSKSYGIKYKSEKSISEPLIFWQGVTHKPKRRNEKDEFIGLIKRIYTMNISQVKVDIKYVEEVMKFEPIDFKRIYNSYWVEKMASQCETDIYVSPDKNDRIHHNMSGAAKALRPALTVNGDPIHCIDISSSQPYFAIKRLLAYTKQKANTSDITIAFQKFPDVEQYINNVVSGNFYKSLLNHLQLNAEDMPTLKKNMLSPFFGSRDPKRLSRERKAIQSLYPTVDLFIKSLKNKEYTDASKILQRTESDLVINHVVKRVIDEGKCKWFLTVHDSILCMANDIEYCRAILVSECSKYIGYAPHLKIEKWTKDKVVFPDLKDKLVYKEFQCKKTLEIERYQKEQRIKKIRKKYSEDNKKRLKSIPLPRGHIKRSRSRSTNSIAQVK